MNTQHTQDHGITEDDPLLTAYALGELDGEELARIEDALSRDQALRVSVDRIRVTCGAITEVLAHEPAALSSSSAKLSAKKAVSQAENDFSKNTSRRTRSGALLQYPGLYFVVGGLSAACFAILSLLQAPVPEGPGLAGTSKASRVIVPLPPVEDGPADGVAGSEKTVVEEVAEAPVPTALSKSPAVPDKPETLVAEVHPAPSSSVAGAVGTAAKEPSETTQRPLFEPKLQLPMNIVSSAGPAKASLFEGYGAGSSLRPFEGANASEDRAYVPTAAKPVSELGVRVESASYAQVRRALNEGRRPDKASVQIEQLVNAFSFVADQSAASGVQVGRTKRPDVVPSRTADTLAPLVTTQIEYAPAPWNPAHLLVRVALQARPQPVVERPAERLLVLAEDGLSADARRLLLEALRGMVGRLRKNDRVILGRLGGGLELVCSADAGVGRWDLQAGIEILSNGEHTAAGYVSEEILREAGQATRIIVCSAGRPQLPEGVLSSPAALSVLTLGDVSLSPQTFAELSQRASFRSDRALSVDRARELLMEEAGSPDPVVARRTLLKTEFNSKLVGSYRILGYEGDAQSYAPAAPSDLLAGQSFTALYELVPTALAKTLAEDGEREELLKVGLSYEDTQKRVLRRHHFVVLNGTPAWDRASDDFRFAAAVAAMGMIMRDSSHRGTASLEKIGHWASGRGVTVPAAEREEFSLLLERAKRVF